ncbi:MAG: 50S ribosomal protein L1, partial [Planctomycetia bacterium]|nr:50S ribosomal protein L1 [Planctomycetia bacterium]
MAKQSKRMRALREKTPAKIAIPLEEAVRLLKTFGNTKFDQTVEISMRLGIDAKQADQIVRGSVVLPNGIGKSLRVIVFAKGDKLDE